MESCKLEIFIHSGKGLTDVKHFGTMDPYVLVWLAGEYERSPVYRTQTAIKGASCPVWNLRVEFNIASRHKNYTLFCEIKHDGTFLDRDIGQVRIIILSHTISLGENVTDMKTIEPVNLGQSAMGVIKEMATEVAKEAKDALLSAMEASFRD
ncbi:calcium-dependent lipid-binding family protein [Tanacetum coccineum]